MARVQRNVENSTSGRPVSSSYNGFIPPEKGARLNMGLSHRSEMTADVWASGIFLLWLGLSASQNSVHRIETFGEINSAFQFDESMPSLRQAKDEILGPLRRKLAPIFFTPLPAEARLEVWDTICTMLVHSIPTRPTISEVFERISKLQVI